MESHNKYTLNGFNITSNPPRGRNRCLNISIETTTGENSSSHCVDHSSNHTEVLRDRFGTFGNTNIVERSAQQEDEIPLENPPSFTTVSDFERSEFSSKSYKYSYFDHPADVIIMGEGVELVGSLESIIMGLYNYMSDLSGIEMNYKTEISVEAFGPFSLLYHILDECLCLYNCRYFIARHIKIKNDIQFPLGCTSVKEFEDYKFKVCLTAYGDYFNPKIHVSGTEVKAITMHHLKFKFTVNCKEITLENTSDSIELLLNELNNPNDNTIKCCKSYALIDI